MNGIGWAIAVAMHAAEQAGKAKRKTIREKLAEWREEGRKWSKFAGEALAELGADSQWAERRAKKDDARVVRDMRKKTGGGSAFEDWKKAHDHTQEVKAQLAAALTAVKEDADKVVDETTAAITSDSTSGLVKHTDRAQSANGDLTRETPTIEELQRKLEGAELNEEALSQLALLGKVICSSAMKAWCEARSDKDTHCWLVSTSTDESWSPPDDTGSGGGGAAPDEGAVDAEGADASGESDEPSLSDEDVPAKSEEAAVTPEGASATQETKSIAYKRKLPPPPPKKDKPGVERPDGTQSGVGPRGLDRLENVAVGVGWTSPLFQVGEEEDDSGNDEQPPEGQVDEGKAATPVNGPGKTGPVPVKGEPPNSEDLRDAVDNPELTEEIKTRVGGVIVRQKVSFRKEKSEKLEDGTEIGWGTYQNETVGKLLVVEGKEALGPNLWFHVDGKDGHQYAWVQYVDEGYVWKDPQNDGKEKRGSRSGEGYWHIDPKGKDDPNVKDDKFYPNQASDKADGKSLMTDQPRVTVTGSTKNPTDLMKLIGKIDKESVSTFPMGVTQLKLTTKFETFLVDTTSETVVGKFEHGYEVRVNVENFMKNEPMVSVLPKNPIWTRFSNR